MDDQNKLYKLKRLFFTVFLLICLLGVFYIPDNYTDCFFTPGMIWQGVTIPIFFVIFLFFIVKRVRFSWIWLYAAGLILLIGLYSLWLDVFSIQQFSYMLVLLLSGILFNYVGRYLKPEEVGIGVTGVAIVQAFIGIFQYIGWSPVYNVHFPVTGTFDNPAGLAMYLAVSFPFVVSFVFSTVVWKRIGGCIAAVVLVLGICLSGSRTGIIALSFIVGITIWQHFKIPPRIHHIVYLGVAIVGIILLMGLYYLKKDSADGRLLIWRCTYEMIREKPLLGHGPESFGGKYMLYQADYLSKYPNERQDLLADNVKHPFNEYLKICTEFGLVGLLIIGIGVLCVIRMNMKSEQKSPPALISFMAFMICGLFSYPLNYPAVSFLLVLICGLLTYEGKMLIFEKKWIRITGIFLAIGLLSFTVYWQRMEVRWACVAHQALAGEQEVLPLYSRLYPFLKENPLFLYNYGAELHERRLWRKSAVTLEKCSRLLNDTDVQMLLAENYFQQGNVERAEKCLLLAFHMCPNRFLPLVRLVKLYDSVGRYEDAVYWAKIIIRKPVKIQSYRVNRIKEEMTDYLEKNKD